MKKHQFTWIDGLVIAVVVLLIAGTCYRFLSPEIAAALADDTTEFQYELKIGDVRQYTVDAIQVGDELYNTAGKGTVGVITDIRVTNAVTTYAEDDGTILHTTNENHYDVYLTVTAKGRIEDGLYKIGTYTMLVNQSATYYTKYSTWGAAIIAID